MRPDSPTGRDAPRPRRSAGFSLIDVLIVIVVLGIAAVTLTKTSGDLAGQSAASLRTQQAMVFAQGLLDEVRSMPFTTNDIAPGGTALSGTLDALGPEAGETRYSVTNRFDGVSDYSRFTMPGPGCAGLCDIQGNLMNPAGSPLAACSATVTLGNVVLVNVPAANALRILVTVRCPGMDDVSVDGIRIRYAPTAL